MMLHYLRVSNNYLIFHFIFFLLLLCINNSNAQIYKKKDIVIAGRGVKDTAGYYYWTNFSDNIKKSLNDRYTIKTFLNAELGPEETIFRNLRRNKIQIAGISASGLSLIVPELSILRLPYLFNNEDEIEYILESDVKELIASLLLNKGLVMLDWMYGGWVNFYTTFPLNTPANLKGKRIRVSVDDISIKLMKVLGADFTQIPFTDIIPALQSGLIDGGEQSTQLFISGGLFTQAKYYTISQHAYVLAAVVANAEWFSHFNTEEKNIFYKSLMQNQIYKKLVLDENQKLLNRLSKKYLDIYSLNHYEKNKFRAKAQPLIDNIIINSSYNEKKLYNLILKKKNEFQKLPK